MMENLNLYKSQLSEISAIISKLEEGNLSKDEVITLETLTRSLHERSIILKYKVFSPTLFTVKQEEVNEETEMESQVSEPFLEKESEIDFSIFETPEIPEEILEVKAEIEAESPKIIEVVDAVTEEEVQIIELIEEEQVEEIKIEKTENGSFIDNLSFEDKSLNSLYGGSKLDTLIGAFGLNEKLRYINDLFDGSSEMFSEAIKAIDGKNSLEEAKIELKNLAEQHGWDADEESVTEFMGFVARRHG